MYTPKLTDKDKEYIADPYPPSLAVRLYQYFCYAGMVVSMGLILFLILLSVYICISEGLSSPLDVLYVVIMTLNSIGIIAGTFVWLRHNLYVDKLQKENVARHNQHQEAMQAQEQ